MLIGESNVAIDPAIGGYGVADIYLGEFSPQHTGFFYSKILPKVNTVLNYPARLNAP